ncbi:unannotated protein [freshwater metagenome]|uniref:Unannotated protein n=1 Tax=freshwater metagenome TaxID=449393 RepID=A0A6J6XEM0_9ZZZZ
MVTLLSTGRDGTYSKLTSLTTTSPTVGSSTASAISLTSGCVSRMPNNFCNAAPEDCTVLYSCDNCCTGSNKLPSSNTNAVTTPTLTEPRCTSHPPTPIIEAVARMPQNSTRPKYHIEILMLSMWLVNSASFVS